MEADLERLAAAAEELERQAGELRKEIERLAEVAREQADADAGSVASSTVAEDDSDARLVAYSMVLDGKSREDVAAQLEREFGLTDSDSLLDDVYSRAGGRSGA
jgi:hypothetical protein